MPSPFEALLLGLAAWRTWHLLASDEILDRPRNWLCQVDDRERVGREQLADFIECPYCLGFWVALWWVGAFVLWPAGVIWAALVMAIAAMPPALNHMLSD